MQPEHASQLELVRALRELGATHVRVGDVECRFDLVLTPIAPPDDRIMGESADTMLRRKMRQLEQELGISQT